MKELTKKDVVVLAVGSLLGANQRCDTEDIAIAAHALAPQAFGWRKHTEHIDLDMVRTSLRHEAESPAPRLAGSIRTGWFLTAAGHTWAAQHAHLTGSAQISVAATPAATGKRRAETAEASAAIDRLRTSAAYRAWRAGRDFTGRQAAEAFRIDDYTPLGDRHRKTARVVHLAADQPDLSEFLSLAVPAALELATPAPTREDS